MENEILFSADDVEKKEEEETRTYHNWFLR